MKYFLVAVLAVFVVMVVVSLVRGIVAFLQTTKIDLETGGENSKALMEAQNRAMFARVKYQALAIGVVAILLLINS
ncbi:MAG: HIG1 domain-containing protein [Erythrobacter sp.]|nr:HIG1 domain-containing protein [Erythrobacter sp.]